MIPRLACLCFLALLTAPPAHAKALGCAALKDFATRISVNVELPNVVYDFSKSRREINRNQHAQHEEWLKKNNMQAIWRASEMETLGYAAGGWGLSSGFRASAKAYDQFATYVCPYVMEVDLDMMYRTIINIPKDFPRNGCTFNLILEHERRHHATNAAIVKTYTGRLKDDLKVIVREIESSQPYVPRQNLQAAYAAMEQALKDALDIYLTQAIAIEMKKRNGVIDSPKEYMQTGALIDKCGGK